MRNDLKMGKGKIAAQCRYFSFHLVVALSLLDVLKLTITEILNFTAACIV